MLIFVIIFFLSSCICVHAARRLNNSNKQEKKCMIYLNFSLFYKKQKNKNKTNKPNIIYLGTKHGTLQTKYNAQWTKMTDINAHRSIHMSLI